ncbi:rhamnan synthesis F family protein [Parvibaculum sp.]|uniref:rhamnan synthesis F family protein n=1 Tax=Parvibaculum sp. TaxID=2024848 RepID=UPI001D4D3D01|nr:rhamnan synthesis F family protein [Parvibaculum sp.]MBX3489278.1 hypothetical protein [Parvibaculum sp.]
MGLATGWRFGRRTSLYAAAGEGPDGRASVRLTAAHGGPLAAGRYLLDVETRAQDVPVLTIDVDTAREEVVHAVDLDFGNADRGGRVKALAPIVLTQDAPSLIVSPARHGDALSDAQWRLRERSYATFYGGLSLRFAWRLLAGRASYPMLREAIRRNGVKGFGGAVRGDWEAALALPRSRFSKRMLEYPERVGTMARAAAIAPSLRVIGDLSRGAAVPEIDAALVARARLAGLSAICLPCAWSDGKLRLDDAVRRFLDNANVDADFPFFLRRIDAPRAERFDRDSEIAFVEAIAPFLRDRRALRVDTKLALGTPPLAQTPDAEECAALWRGAARAAGLDEIFVVGADVRDAAVPAWVREDETARLPDTPPSCFGRAVHAAMEAASRDARDGEPAPFVVDLAAGPDGGGLRLEDDSRYGYAWIEALRVAQARCAVATPAPRPLSAALVVHAYYPDVLEEILATLRNTATPHRLYVTTTTERRADIERLLVASGRDYALRVFDNRGRDVLPFLKLFDELRGEGLDLVAKIHTKRSLHRKDGAKWRRALVEPLFGRDNFERIVTAFEQDVALGMIGPDEHLTGLRNNILANEARVFGLARRLGLTSRDVTQGSFLEGSMFVVRVQALAPLMSLAIGEDDFEPEAGQLDGTLAHAIERGLALSVVASGMRVAGVEDVLRRRSVLWNMSG